MPDKCWFWTIKGILISGGILVILLFSFILAKSLIAVVRDHPMQFSLEKAEFSKTIGFVITACGMWGIFILEYMVHRKDYFYFYSDRFDFKIENQQYSILLEDIQFVESLKQQYLIHKKSGEKIRIKKSSILYGCEQPKDCLEDICRRFPK